MDVLIGKEIFEPMGITNWSWSLDRSGNPHGMSGLQILPADLVKIGQMMMNDGSFDGQQVLPRSFVEEAVGDQVAPSPPADPQQVPFDPESFDKLGYGRHYGLLWWLSWEPELVVTERLIKHWREGSAPEEFLKKMASASDLTGRPLMSRVGELVTEREWFAATVERGLMDWDVKSWTKLGYSAEGYLGQYLMVMHEYDLIAVRMRRSPRGEFDERSIDQFRDFKQRVTDLVFPPQTD